MPRRSPSPRSKTSGFPSEQAANEHKEHHQMHGLVAMPLTSSTKWALVFPLECHVTVIPHIEACRRDDAQRAMDVP